MDRLDSMRLLVRVIERASFTAAAADLSVPRSTATDAIGQLEARLKVKLLNRTTRRVSPTPEGEAYYRRCVAILSAVEDAEASLRGGEPEGLLRIDVHGTMLRHFLLPRLPGFLERHPKLRLHIGEGDRLVDLVREDVDCVLRAGEPADSGMIARRIAVLHEITCASPAYLARHGVPDTPDELTGHRMVGFHSSRTADVLPLEFSVAGAVRTVALPCRITVTGSETLAALARLGFGLVQAPLYRFEADLAQGTLVEVLPDFRPVPTPVSLLYPPSKQLAPRVRVFLDWVAALFRPYRT